MARKKPISERSPFVRPSADIPSALSRRRSLQVGFAQRPSLAPDWNRSNHRIDELDAQSAWAAHTCPEPRRRIAAGRIEIG